ncbi:MAG: TSUP family transporter [Sphingosinicella sp.]
MGGMLIALLVPMALGALVYLLVLLRTAIARGQTRPRAEAVAVGAATNFFDTLGIGSFAPTLAWLKLRRHVADRCMPCTMIVAHTLPTMAQAAIFLVLLGVLIDPVLLAGCVVALVVGGLVGAPLVARANIRLVQGIVGCALIAAALFYALANLELMPAGGTATSLPAPLTAMAIAGNFVLGVLLNFGVGNYAPTLVMLGLMGMDPRLAFPIMAAGGGLMLAGTSVRHIAAGTADLRIAISVLIGGVPAVLVAAFIVKSMPIEWLRWLVIVVVLYAAAMMLRSASAGQDEESEAGSAGRS